MDEKPAQVQSQTNAKLKKPNPWGFVVLGCLVLLFCAGVCVGLSYMGLSAISSSQAQKANQNGNNVSTAEINSSKNVGDYTYKLNSVTKDGENYVLELTVINNSTSSKNFSSWLQMDLVSESGQSFSQNIFYDLPSDLTLDKDISARQSITGKVVYKVASQPKGLNLVVKDSVFSETKVNFRIL